MDTKEVNLDRLFGTSAAANLVQHKQRRKRPAVGDYFAIEVADHGWIAGRVIIEDPPQVPGVESGPFEDTYLVYLYKGISKECPASGDLPRKPILILPPMIVARELWTKGFFVPVCPSTLMGGEKLERHCFFSMSRRVPFDEFGKKLNQVYFPCGSGGVLLLGGVQKWIGYSLANGFDQDHHPLS